MDVVINACGEVMPPAAKSLVGEQHYLLNTLAAMGGNRERPALAALLQRYHQLSGSWLIVSPLHWQATHNDAMIVAVGDGLQLDDKLARIWFAEVTQFLAADGMQLVYHDATTWLVNMGKKPPITSQCVYHLLHHSFMPALEALDESMYWQRLITELQMFMGSHPLNHGRQLPVNGLWFWGEGADLPTCQKPLISDDPIVQQVFPACQSWDETFLPARESVVVLSQPQPEQLKRFSELTSKISSNWYWNNMAYHRKAQTWWSKLWRK